MKMISIIITAYKEAGTIGKAIEAILQNKIPDKYEILILAPDEETLNMARKYSKKYKKLKVIKDKAEGKPAALNLAFKEAKGDILVLTDGDVYVSENAIPLIIEKFKNPEIGAATGRPIPINDKRNMLGFWGHLLFYVAHKRRETALKLKKRIFCSGYFYAFRNIVDKIPEETLSEDGFISQIIYSKGYRIEYSPESEVYVKYPSTFKDWLIQKKRSVGGYNQIKMWIDKEIRSFKKESLGLIDVLKYPKNIREFFYTFALIFARLYLWLLIFIDINIKKKKLKEIWLRAKSTK
jgi:cellulose synthase/poly-beta-1,6-N-acetylglucosamine synthase-like glycosyltransferase